MKKSALFLTFLFVFSAFPFFHYANAEISNDNTNWGIKTPEPDPPQSIKQEASEKVWQGEHDEVIYDNFGSDQSPAFLNRENINPTESDYGYGTPNGNE